MQSAKRRAAAFSWDSKNKCYGEPVKSVCYGTVKQAKKIYKDIKPWDQLSAWMKTENFPLMIPSIYVLSYNRSMCKMMLR